jgi:hypothetical protein
MSKKSEEDKIIEIMRELYLHPTGLSKEYFINKFGMENWELFSNFSFGTTTPYVIDFISDNTHTLTPEGVREYHKLVKERNEAKRNAAYVYATIAMSTATVMLFLYNTVSFLKITLPISSEILLGLGAVIATALMGIFLKKAIDTMEQTD